METTEGNKKRRHRNNYCFQYMRNEIDTWPPVSGKPKTLACPKKPWGDNITTLNTIGTLPRKVSRVEGSGAWRISSSRCIVSNTLSALSPQPLSKPIPCNLHSEQIKGKKKIKQKMSHEILAALCCTMNT